MKEILAIFFGLLVLLNCASNKNKLIINQEDVSRHIATIKDKKEICIVDLSGQIINQIKMDGSEIYSLTWSPNGTILAFLQSEDEEIYLYIYDVLKDQNQKLCKLSLDYLDLKNIPKLKWMKDNDQLYFSDEQGLNIVNLKGEKSTLYNLKGIENFNISDQ